MNKNFIWILEYFGESSETMGDVVMSSSPTINKPLHSENAADGGEMTDPDSNQGQNNS